MYFLIGMPYSSSTSAALDIGLNALYDGENFDQIGDFSEHLSKVILDFMIAMK
jgi:hypothetical protein